MTTHRKEIQRYKCCPVCGGMEFYAYSGNCVPCNKVKLVQRLRLIGKRISGARKDRELHSLERECVAMAGVRYENVSGKVM